jgi:general secretion pathway protein M
MLRSITSKLRPSLMFIAVNLALALFVLSFLIIPLASVYLERADQIAESREQLARIRALQPALASGHQQADAAAGAHFVAVRGMEPTRFADASLVTASIEIRGSVYAVRDAVRRIEDHKPALVIKSATLRSASADQDSELHADFTVQGLMQRTSNNAADTRGDNGARGR